MNLEEYKYLIVRQFNEPKSALRCLLATEDFGKRGSCGPTNLPEKPFAAFASEFGVTAKFELLATDGMEVRKRDGVSPVVYSIIFSESDNSHAVNLTDVGGIDYIKYVEEVIECDGDKLVFGLRRFTIAHNRYKYQKVYHGDIEKKCYFDIHSLTFDRDFGEVYREWFSDRNVLGATGEWVYLDYEFVEDEKKKIESFFLKNGLSQKMSDALIACFSTETNGYSSAMYKTLISLISRNFDSYR